MSTAYKLAPQAQWRLKSIFLWTLERFGEAQAERYNDSFLERFNAIARGDAHMRDCARLAPEAKTLKMSRCGAHFVVFTKVADTTIIVDLIPASADLPSWLAKLDPPET